MNDAVDPNLALGTVALTVSDLYRSLVYYQERIGMTLLRQEGNSAELGLPNRPLLRLEEQPGARLVRRATGLYHFAVLLPSRLDLARCIRHLVDRQTRVDGAADHHVSEALYLSDPDGHGIEIYRDRPRDQWTDAQGRFLMTTEQLDFAGIMGELQPDIPAWGGLPDGTVMGHVHLQVADVPAAEAFYTGALGFDRMARLGTSAAFVSAGGYHHHLGLNSWASAGAPPSPDGAARLQWYELLFSGPAALDATLARLRAAGVTPTADASGWTVRDPSANVIRLRVVS